MKNETVKNSIIGLVLADALGVPVESKSREELDRNPLKDMIGYGTYNQPPGSWSDDSSMTLVTMECLTRGYNPEEIMKGFCKWAYKGYMTPYGRTFNIGNTTAKACKNFKINKDIKTCGETSEFSNGNGSLMRILPLSIYLSNETEKVIIQKSFEISALTHNHIRSKIACALYSLIVTELFKGKNLYEALTNANRIIAPHIPKEEKIHFKRITDFEILQLNRRAVKSSGYVIDTLEASLWCLLNSSNYKEAVLKAINLGIDTDTTAAVTGGLAGILFGLEFVSSKWIKSLAKLKYMEQLIENFANSL